MTEITIESGNEKKPTRDWFGYILTGIFGILVTVAATWYQLYVSDRQAMAAEMERARAVRQSVIAIVEELVLNDKKLDADRIGRLIDQRRRDQNVAIAISTVDVVQQAEFNISSSSYLSVDRKEQIRPAINSFYADLAARSFSTFPASTPNADLLNELVKQIQDGKTADALSSVRRLEELQADAINKLSTSQKPSFVDAVENLFDQPYKLAFIGLTYLVLIRVSFVFLQKRRRLRALRPGVF